MVSKVIQKGKALSKAEKEREYVDKATAFSERYGIVDYDVHGNKMIFYQSYRAYLSEPRRTYKHTVNLDTMKEEPVELLKRFNARGYNNV